MFAQNQIKRKLSEAASIEIVRDVLKQREFKDRTAVAGEVCARFGFQNRAGKPQRSGCLKALRKLEREGHFVLPGTSGKAGAPKSPRRLSEPVPPVEGLPEQVQDVTGLKLILVVDEAHMRIWNEMMLTDHPQGAGPLVGRQLRYLIASDYGWLGGLAFAAAALHLAARDEWIGWDFTRRGDYLERVVGLSRLLIRRDVRCANLASRVLGMAMQAMPADFKARYGFEPYLVESFVDTASFSGTVYRAANWIKAGCTQGRGRQDRERKAALPVKDIYVYPLVNGFRKRLGLPAQAGLGGLRPSEGLDREDWAGKEFADAPLGDTRLSGRLVEIAAMKGAHPSKSFCAVAQGDRMEIKNYYRFIDKPDGSDLNYNNLDQCEGLGTIGTNQTGAQSRGLHLHSTLALTTSGLPLGVLNAKCEARQPRENKEKNTAIPIEEKDTFCWIEALRDTVEVAAEMPGTRLVNVLDREADFFELFDEQRNNPAVDVLVRAKHNRCLLDEQGDDGHPGPDRDGDKKALKLFETVRETSLKKTIAVKVPRQSARPKKSKQKARPKREARIAQLSIRYMPVRLPAPSHHHAKEPIDLWLVHALEEIPPEGEEPVERFLLTSIEVDSAETAVECVRWYCLRWRIEDWHRVLKSGCRVEDLANKTAERLRRAIAIDLVIAWRIMLMSLLGREMPDLPAEVLFTDIELKVLDAYAKKKLESPELLR